MPQETGSRKLNNAPLVYVLAQVRYSPILSMEKYIPDIQEQVRKVFPKYKKTVVQSLTVGANDQAPDVSRVDRWEFANKESDTGFILQADSFVFHTTNYEKFKDFIGHFKFALTQVQDAVDISLVERVGLRYIDAIEPKDGEDLGKYMVPGLCGFPLGKLNTNMLISHTEAVARSAVGTLILKATQKQDSRVLPPDLSPVGLFVQRSMPQDRTTAIFDFDHYCEQSFDFSVEEIVKRAAQLHDVTSKAFWATVTDYAIEQWN